MRWMALEAEKLYPRLNEEALQILKEAETAINRYPGDETDSAGEIYLTALHRNQWTEPARMEVNNFVFYC